MTRPERSFYRYPYVGLTVHTSTSGPDSPRQADSNDLLVLGDSLRAWQAQQGHECSGWGPPMRLLIVSQYFWPEAFRINDLARELVARGHEVSVLTGFPTYPSREAFPQCRPADDHWHGVQIARVPLIGRDEGQRWRMAANYASYAASASLLGPLRVRRRHDVILAFQMSPVTVILPALVIGRLWRKPVVAWVQDLWPESLAAVGAVRSEWMLQTLKPPTSALYRACTLVLAHSEDFLPALLARGVSQQRLAHLPAWAEEHYRPVPPDPSLARELRLPTGFIAMIAGNLGIAQSLETVIGAAERLRADPSVHWVVVGDGQRRAWLAEEVARRGLTNQVHLVGRHPVERMPHLLAHADVLVATLRSDPVFSMTLPARVQSYLACGRPVVAAMDGEGARVVRGAGGLAVPAGDAAGLAAAIADMRAMDPSWRRAAGDAARAYYLKHFERSMLLDRFEAHLVAAAGRARGSPGCCSSSSIPDGDVACGY